MPDFALKLDGIWETADFKRLRLARSPRGQMMAGAETLMAAHFQVAPTVARHASLDGDEAWMPVRELQTTKGE